MSIEVCCICSDSTDTDFVDSFYRDGFGGQPICDQCFERHCTCPKCNSGEATETNGLITCPECNHNWRK